MMHTATLVLAGHEQLAQGTPDTAAWLLMVLLNFSTVWMSFLVIITVLFALCSRRRPGGWLTSGPLAGSRSSRKRIDGLLTALSAADGARASLPDAAALAVRVCAYRRWATARSCLYGPANLAAGLMLYGAFGGWGGPLLPTAAVVSAGLLALAVAATVAETISRRRADPYGEAAFRGVVALEALVMPDSAESRVRTLRGSLHARDRRPTAYFPVDWSYRTVEESVSHWNGWRAVRCSAATGWAGRGGRPRSMCTRHTCRRPLSSTGLRPWLMTPRSTSQQVHRTMAPTRVPRRVTLSANCCPSSPVCWRMSAATG